MEIKAFKTKNPISGDYTFIVVAAEKQDASYWSAHYLILTKSFAIDSPITHYTLEGNRFLQNIEEALAFDGFINQVSEHAKCAFEVAFAEKDNNRYTNLLVLGPGIQFEELDPKDCITRVILSCTNEQVALVDKLCSAAYSQDLESRVRLAKKLRDALNIDKVD